MNSEAVASTSNEGESETKADIKDGIKVEIKGQKKAQENKDLIDVMNELQIKISACGHVLNMSLPQIVVVGPQSSGKSSTLENFIGREFLPRGTDTVTRRPTVIQMTPCHNEEYVVFAHKPGIKFTDFQKVREEIEAETNRHPGPKGFSSDPICLEIFSPRVLKLTVVDTPGLIRNVEDGHDKKSIEEVRKICLKYITPKETLIVAMIPALQDFLTSDALQIAEEVDPKRERTIGVVTKLDSPHETDFKPVFENRKIYLQLGYVGLVNRSKVEMEEGKDFDYGRKKEREFFENHPVYRNFKNRMGTPYLIQMLQQTLRSHIKKFLPSVRSDIKKELSSHQKELEALKKRLGAGRDGRKQGPMSYVSKLIQRFSEDIEIHIMGYSARIPTSSFTAGAKIKYVLDTEVRRLLSLNLVPDETRAQIIMVNILGIRTAISIPSLAVDVLSQLLLVQYKDPIELSVMSIRDVLKICIKEAAESMDRYPSLRNEVIFLVKESIDIEASNCKDRLLSHIDAEMFHINFNHPDFKIAECDPVAPPAGPVKLWETKKIPANDSGEEFFAAHADLTTQDSEEARNSEEEKSSSATSTETLLARLKANQKNQKNAVYACALLAKYLEPVQKEIEDFCLKYIIYFLVKKVLDFIKSDLLGMILDSDNFSSLSEDCQADFKWKEKTENTCKILQEALDVVQNF